MSRNVQKEIEDKIKNNKVVLFMKGTAQMPQCGYSAQAVNILKGIGYPFISVNILLDQAMREEIKIFSDWPTLPQLYIDGQFYGGCDQMVQLYQSHELQKILERSFQGVNSLVDTPSDMPKPKQVVPISAKEAAQFLKHNPQAKLLDVRTEQEWATAHAKQAELIDQAKADAYIASLDKNTPLLLMCHHGMRSLTAAQYFLSRGFSTVYNVSGGIDAWSLEVDTEVPRY